MKLKYTTTVTARIENNATENGRPDGRTNGRIIMVFWGDCCGMLNEMSGAIAYNVLVQKPGKIVKIEGISVRIHLTSKVKHSTEGKCPEDREGWGVEVVTSLCREYLSTGTEQFPFQNGFSEVRRSACVCLRAKCWEPLSWGTSPRFVELGSGSGSGSDWSCLNGEPKWTPSATVSCRAEPTDSGLYFYSRRKERKTSNVSKT